MAGSRLVHFAAAVAVACFAPQPVAAESVATGNELLSSCSSTEGIKIGVCIGFVSGFNAAINLQSYRNKLDPPYCLPDGVTMRQTIDIIVKYLNDGPTFRHMPSDILTLAALRKAFPCAPQK